MSNQVMKIGGFEVASLSALEELCKKLANSNIVPKHYQGRPNDIFVAGLYGGELGLSLLASLQGIAVINGRPSIWGDALLGIVRSHPDFLDITEEFDVETQTATCTVMRAAQKDTVRQFSMADAKRAKLDDKAGVWTQYPTRMLQMRARSFALRDAFADALSGFITREEAEDIPVEEKDVTPVASKKGASAMLEIMKSEEVEFSKRPLTPLLELEKESSEDESPLDKMLNLIIKLDIPRETQEKWLSKASVKNFEEMPEDSILKITSYLEQLTINKEEA